MKRREQPISIPDGETHYELSAGPFSEKGSGVLCLARPWTIETIPLGVRLRKLLRSPTVAGESDPDVLMLPPSLLKQDRAVAEDAGKLLCQAWRHPTYELEHTGAAACDELVETVGGAVASLVLSRIIVEAASLMQIDDIYTWEVAEIAAPPTGADDLPSASA